MFIREVKNRSGSISIQIISKSRGKYKVVRSFGSGRTIIEINQLKAKARAELSRLEAQAVLFPSHQDDIIENFLAEISNDQVRVIGPELLLGKIYDGIGFSIIEDSLFRHLVITRIISPGSKLKTIDYLKRYQGIEIYKDEIYRFLDKLHSKYKKQVEQVSFNHTLKISKGNIGVVFYDMTTLHFEASDEDDLRKTGFSKVGKHQNPQIYLGLLVTSGGYPIGYDIYEGNIYEGHTLLPFIRKFESRYKLNKPTVVADAGLLSTDNITALEQEGYQYIIGARIKNESTTIKNKILELNLENEKHATIKKEKSRRLIITYSDKRAKKDEYNRKRGLARLEKDLRAGKLTKSSINRRGYNKYLVLDGMVDVKIDYEKFRADKQWDGLKGFLTNTKIKANQVIENYANLWHIERAFRISKTDLKIRPIYHRLKHRIEAHICISFTAYSILKELERILKKEKSKISPQRAAEITKNMYQISLILPETKQRKNVMLKKSHEQEFIFSILNKYY
jgi:transposase